ncbi:MAG: YigZ family protein [Clostridiales bacterium]|nr:YigZ family protein [Clostridiales bacterium]
METTVSFTEKKSVFIGTARIVSTPDEAKERLAEIKNAYSDATHNCWAYITGINGGVRMFSDDGEPSGTAGAPICNVLEKRGLTNILVVITRYFGGIKLGAGGLVRAYSACTAQLIEACGEKEYCIGSCGVFHTSYQNRQLLERLLLEKSATITNREYGDNVSITASFAGEWDVMYPYLKERIYDDLEGEYLGVAYIDIGE